MATREVDRPDVVDVRDDPAHRFKVVLICTGNRCCSPVAEALLRKHAGALPVTVSSAGVVDVGATSVPDELVAAARDFGIELVDHRPRTMRSVDLTEADIVLGFEWGHIAAAVVEGRAPYDRTFTLKGLVRLLDGRARKLASDPVKNAKRMVALAHGRRTSIPGYAPEDNIADPFGGPIEGYVEMLRATDELCHRVIAQLFASNGRQVIRLPGAARRSKRTR